MLKVIYGAESFFYGIEETFEAPFIFKSVQYNLKL